MDKYQARYQEHQKRKRGQLLKIMRKRYSDRIFGDREIEDFKIKIIEEVIDLVPSSCDRKAIHYKWVTSRDDKQILSGFLVGGVGWIHRADRIMLLFGDKFAYKENLFYMPYIDAGCVIQQVYLACTELDLAVCYVNPNIRVAHYPAFDGMFTPSPDHLFCGAIAMGYKDED